MFDLSSDIITVNNFEMFENNANEYYYNYNDDTPYDINFEEFDSGPLTEPLMDNYPNQNFLYDAQPQYMNQYDGVDDQSPSYRIPQPQPVPASVPQQHMSVNVNLSVVNNELPTPQLQTPVMQTPVTQSPNNLMYPVSYDVISGNSYHDYVPQMSAPVDMPVLSQPSYDYYGQLSNQLTQTKLAQHQQKYRRNSSSKSKSSLHSPSSTSSVKDKKPENKVITSNGSNFKIIRGIAAGGSAARPPKQTSENKSIYLPIELNLIGGSVDDICSPSWSFLEKQDKRRIVRIERIQKGPKLIINFSIVGAANENPTVLPPPVNSNIDVIEVSCLECSKKLSNEESVDDTTSDDGFNNSPIEQNNNLEFDYYITSVEVIEIVELLIGTKSATASERRKERGRVRSNLVPFWSKRPISSRNEANHQPDYRIELAKRIMSYEIRKPRGFDKEVRILKWDRLIPALKRALQCYYCEIPEDYQDDF